MQTVYNGDYVRGLGGGGGVVGDGGRVQINVSCCSG